MTKENYLFETNLYVNIANKVLFKTVTNMASYYIYIYTVHEDSSNEEIQNICNIEYGEASRVRLVVRCALFPLLQWYTDTMARTVQYNTVPACVGCVYSASSIQQT